jgi:predicted small lipoprotein YifL
MAYSVSALAPINPSMKRIGIPNIAVIICCCLALSLAACGQRGPLFLPQEEEQTEGSETMTGAEENTGKNAEESDEETPRT